MEAMVSRYLTARYGGVWPAEAKLCLDDLDEVRRVLKYPNLSLRQKIDLINLAVTIVYVHRAIVTGASRGEIE